MAGASDEVIKCVVLMWRGANFSSPKDMLAEENVVSIKNVYVGNGYISEEKGVQLLDNVKLDTVGQFSLASLRGRLTSGAAGESGRFNRDFVGFVNHLTDSAIRKVSIDALFVATAEVRRLLNWTLDADSDATV